MNTTTITITRDKQSYYRETRKISQAQAELIRGLRESLTNAQGLEPWVSEQLRGVIKRLLGLNKTVVRLEETERGLTVVLSAPKKRKAPAPAPAPAPEAPAATPVTTKGESLATLWVKEHPEWKGSKTFADGSYALKS